MTQPRAGIGAGTVTVILTLLGWSTVPLLLRDLSQSVDFWTNNGWRYGASALFWLPLVGYAWWRQRLRLEARMAALLLRLDGEWLGPWRCLLAAPPPPAACAAAAAAAQGFLNECFDFVDGACALPGC